MPATPRRLVAVFGLIGIVIGAAFGFARGLDHLPTLPVAMVEGALLFGVPALLLGLLVATVVAGGRAARGFRK